MRSVTEEYYDNCPNCGAAVGSEYRNCPYCGTSMVVKRTTSTDENMQKDTRKVDIISKTSVELNGFGGIAVIAFLTIWIFGCLTMSIVSWVTMNMFNNEYNHMIGGGIGGGISSPLYPMNRISPAERLLSLLPLLFAIGGMVALAVVIRKRVIAAKAAKSTTYYARVLDHSVVTERRGNNSYIEAAIKVLANIEGRELCILISTDDPLIEAKYPVGSTVQIAGSGVHYVLVG